MPLGGRKKPFSAKQKKKQLHERRERKKQDESSVGSGSKQSGLHSRRKGFKDSSDDENSTSSGDVHKLNQQPGKKTVKGYDPNRYRLYFKKDTKEELQRRKELSMQPFQTLPEVALECNIDDVYKPGTELDIPKRPPWDYNMTKEELEDIETTYFQEYLDILFKKYSDEKLSYFELNLETWRQLWRVFEMSDILLLIGDIRHPVLHFSPALYDHITKELKKPLILVLNKIDLAPASLVAAWKAYFKQRFPELHIVCFTTYPGNKSQYEQNDPGKVFHKKRRLRRGYLSAGPKQLLEACEDIVKKQVDLKSWREKIEGDMAATDDEDDEREIGSINVEHLDTSYAEHVLYKDGVLTIGCIGHPNVGKSSVLNGLMGKKVVSVSRTPGHTKHFQTIFLTPTVKLCDCPGLVFPSLINKAMQILTGLFPIAQVQEPYSVVGYLAQRIPITRLLKLKHPDQEGNTPIKDQEWSAYDVCEAWAEKRGYRTAKAARNDVYRSANSILRLAVDGRLCLCIRPPGFTDQKDYWDKHSDTEEIRKLQELSKRTDHDSNTDSDVASSQSENEAENNDGDESNSQSSETEGDHNENGSSSTKSPISTRNPFSLLCDE